MIDQKSWVQSWWLYPRGPAVGEMALRSTRSDRVPRSRNLVLVIQGYLAAFGRDANTDARYTRRRASETFDEHYHTKPIRRQILVDEFQVAASPTSQASADADADAGARVTGGLRKARRGSSRRCRVD